MIGQNSDNSDFYIYFQVDPVDAAEYNAFTGSDCAMHLTRQDAQKLSVYFFQFSGKVGGVPTTLYTSDSFHSDAKGVLEISMRDWIRRQSARTDDGDLRVYVYLNETDGTAVDSADFTVHVFPGVGCMDLPMPTIKDADIGAAARNYILPPNVIVAPNLNGVKLIVECNAKDFEPTTTFEDTYTGSAITPTGPRSNQLEWTRQTLLAPSGPRGIEIEQLTKKKAYVFEEPPACADLVLVRWTSLTGATRQHVFPVMSFAREWEGKTIVRAGNGIQSEKDALIDVHCRLTGLTAYGFWYYMDLLSANDVHAVQLSPWMGASDVNDAIASSFSLSTVEGGTSETPAGSGFVNFDFNLKMRRYDSI